MKICQKWHIFSLTGTASLAFFRDIPRVSIAFNALLQCTARSRSVSDLINIPSPSKAMLVKIVNERFVWRQASSAFWKFADSMKFLRLLVISEFKWPPKFFTSSLVICMRSRRASSPIPDRSLIIRDSTGRKIPSCVDKCAQGNPGVLQDAPHNVIALKRGRGRDE